MPAADKKKDKKKDVEEVPTVLNGVYMFANGDRYDGEYKHLHDGAVEREGHGTHHSADGMVYVGSWANDKMNGHGRIEYTSGEIYEGEFLNNKFNGKGKYFWPNGSYYDGQFVENRLEGTGVFTDTEKQVWSGTFRYKAAPGLRFKLMSS